MLKSLLFLTSFTLVLLAIAHHAAQKPKATARQTVSFKGNKSIAQWTETHQQLQLKQDPLATNSDELIDVPDAPDMEGYTPNSIKDFEAADPFEALSMISVPLPNNQGTAALSFTMNLPEGRQNMEPTLPIQYSSEGGSSWMGQGWNLITPAIGLDTRWGVPRYDGAWETEMYTLNGEQLSPTNNRSDLVARTRNKQFYPRVEGSFNRIIRHGSNPSDYWWEVTEKDGTRNSYGGREGAVANDAVLKDEHGNIGYWALVERRDPNGNFVRYVYQTVEDPGIAGSNQPGKQIYLSQVLYTGNGGSDGAYKVDLIRDRQLNEAKRKDISIDARLGFKVVSADLLRRVDISFNNAVIRSYEFTYEEGAFYKMLLKSIAELDNTGTVFYKQEFDYYDDIRRSSTDYKSSETAVPWQIGGDGIRGDVVNPIPQFEDDASAISTAKATSKSGGVVVTVGSISGGVWSKKVSVGGGFTYGTDDMTGIVSMIDINGDGLPDKVFKKGTQLFYRANLGVPARSFGDVRPILGVSDFSISETENVGGGGQALPYTGFFGFNYTSSTTTTGIYFADFNGDGLMDIADNGSVYFNRLNEQGNPEFVRNSELTPSPIFTGVIDPSLIRKDTALQAKQERMFPLQDIVRCWEAPVTGIVNIVAPVQLQQILNQTGIPNTKKDGVRASIQLGGTVLWNTIIGPDDFTAKTPTNVTAINVTKGQRIYFRLQSIYNGEEDLVHWDPAITYTTAVTPQSGQLRKASNYYKASEDFILHSKSITGMVKDGSIVIDGMFKKLVTSDSVWLRVTRNRSTVPTILFERAFSGNELFDGTIVIPGSLPVLTDDELHFQLISLSYIDRSAMQWYPHFAYTAITDGTPVLTTGGNPTISGYPMPDNSNYNSWVLAAPPVTSSRQDTVTLRPRISGGNNGTLWLTIKGTDTVYARRHIFINGGVMLDADSIRLIRKANEPLFIEYATDTMDFALAVAPSVPALMMYSDSSYVDSTGVTRDTSVLRGAIPANLYANPAEEYLGPLFRGWGAFGLKGDPANLAINVNALNLNELTGYPSNPDAYTDSSSMSNIQDPSKTYFVMLFPDINKQAWMGYDTSAVYIMKELMSSSRLYKHDVSVDSLGPGSTAVNKTSTTEVESFSFGITAGGVGPSAGRSTAVTTINKDMLDMNGDRYPDLLDNNRIQYTLPHGGLGATVTDMNVGSTESSGVSEGLSFGGEFQEASTGNKTGKSAVAAQKTAKSSMGVSGGATQNDDETGSSWLDMNGDGLMDRVYQNGSVALNLGYRFAPAEPWGHAGIDEASSLSISAGLGVNIDGGSFEGGFGLSRTEGKNSILLVDLNGDGLADELSRSGDDLRVRFNTGAGFGPLINWTGFDDIASIFSVGESYNLAFTIAIPIYIILMKICINPVGNFGHGTSRQEKAFMDIDGDGFSDYLQSKNDGQLFASTSALGRTNMLSKVKGPAGNSYFSIDYERTGNTYQMPQSKWVLKEVTVFDGVQGDGVDTMRRRFTYEGGYQERHEREFYGFSKVITHELNTAAGNAVYRRHIEAYLNTSYYNKGLLSSEFTQDADGKRYTEVINQYDIRGVADSVRFPALIQTEKLLYEGAATPGARTVTHYAYDAIGNLTRISDAGDGNQQDMQITTITYHPDNTNAYIKSVPSVVEVSDAGGVKRRRTTTINNEGDITSIQQFLADGKSAVTNIDYDTYGNVIKLTRPANHNDQRMWYTYEYDDVLHNYPTRITDAYGNVVINTYDYRFGALTRTVSINNEPTEYTFDNHGRIIQFTGPYELAAGNPYTIAIDYHPEAEVPYAVTRHFDPEFQADINVINFADGMARSIQLKKQISLFKGKNVEDELRMVVSGKIYLDAFGRTTKKLFPVTEPIGATNTTYNRTEGTQQSTHSYDVEDRMLQAVLADGATTNIIYSLADGMTSKMVADALNNQQETLTDLRNRKRFTKHYGTGHAVTTRYDYDALNQLIKVQDNAGNTLTNTFDNFGRTSSVEHPDAGRTEFEYDLADNLVKKITPQIRKEIPKGGAIGYKYFFERLTDIDYPTYYQNKVSYTYGEAGSGNKAGRVILQKDASGGQEFFYSMQGQVIKTIRTVMISPVFATTYVSEQEFDSWNRLKKMVYPDGETIRYHYNKGGSLQRIDAIKVGSTYKFVDQIGYDEYDQRVYMRYSNGTENIYKYDAKRRRLSQLQALTPLGGVMMNNIYGYDALSNVLSVVNDVQQTSELGGRSSQQFSYDNLYRLTSASGDYNGSATGNYNLSVTYDELDNIVQKKMEGFNSGGVYDQAYTYNATKPHQAVQVGNRIYKYDLNGNQLGYGDVENYYDEESRLIAVNNAGALSQYTYDADDNRAVKSNGGMKGVWVNGAPAGAVRHEDNYTVYVSPYVSAQLASYVKHYYIEGQRIASKPGHGTFTNISFPNSGLTAGGVDFLRRAALIEQQRIAYYAAQGPSPGPPTDKNFWARPENSGIAAPAFADTSTKVPSGWPGSPQGPPDGPPIFGTTPASRDSVRAGFGFKDAGQFYEGSIYFYHFDKLGSTSYVTNFDAVITQHIQYSPFGETFTKEQKGSFESSYLFNSKGWDNETGLYFYNPSYYDPALSQWLNVLDPTGSGTLGDGMGGYARSISGEGIEGETEDATPTVSKISYGGSVESEKAWVDKKLNTKKKDRLTREMARRLSNNPRLQILGNKTGNKFVDMYASNHGRAYLKLPGLSEDDEDWLGGDNISQYGYRKSLSVIRNPSVSRQSSIRSYSASNINNPQAVRRYNAMNRHFDARTGVPSNINRNSSVRRFSNAKIGNAPPLRRSSTRK